MSFASLGLSEALLKATAINNYQQPTPVQTQAIPLVLNGVDLLATAQTGTGKTAAFLLPLLQRLSQPDSAEPATTPLAATSSGSRPVRALVLAPTRELAAQVREQAVSLARHLPLRSAVVFGGVRLDGQIAALARGVDLLVATPGRLLDLLDNGHLSLEQVQTLVLDEADRMLDMGFIKDIRRILSALPKQRQTLLFSATFNGDVAKFANSTLKQPQRVDLSPKHTSAETVKQRIYLVDERQKTALFCQLMNTSRWQQVLVFASTRQRVAKIAQELSQQGLSAAALQGEMKQKDRQQVLADFKARHLRVLVATDVAARGLDIQQLPQVVNYDLPELAEDYVHRIGRTGRAGASGKAISLVSPKEQGRLAEIEALLDKKLSVRTLDGFAPKAQAKPTSPWQQTSDPGNKSVSANTKKPGKRRRAKLNL